MVKKLKELNGTKTELLLAMIFKLLCEQVGVSEKQREEVLNNIFGDTDSEHDNYIAMDVYLKDTEELREELDRKDKAYTDLLGVVNAMKTNAHYVDDGEPDLYEDVLSEEETKKLNDNIILC